MLSESTIETDVSLDSQRNRLVETIRRYRRVVVAFSGGIDSTVVAQAAFYALAEAAIAVTATSESLAKGELEEAQEIAQRLGIRHRIIRTEEFSNSNYRRNNTDRCYFCKSELYERLELLMGELGANVIVSGANIDDLREHRPGLHAAIEHNVRHPLQECGFSKVDVRNLARTWKLPTWDKPATPCLSSRIAYGEEVTPERNQMIDQAEHLLRTRGFHILRVRYHKGDIARIEVPLEDLPRLLTSEVRGDLVLALNTFGFKFVTVDLAGFRSGSLNTIIPAKDLMRGVLRTTQEFPHRMPESNR
jgi:uncharacterized protein